MNRLTVLALIAAGLTLTSAPEAAAHDEVRVTRVAPAWDVDHRDRKHSRSYYERNGRYNYESRHYRSGKMPRWLKRKDSFRRWYNRTPLRHYHSLTWREMFEIYRWERDYFRKRHYRD